MLEIDRSQKGLAEFPKNGQFSDPLLILPDQLRRFIVGQRILNGKGHLVCHGQQQLEIPLIEFGRIGLLIIEGQGPQNPLFGTERNTDDRENGIVLPGVIEEKRGLSHENPFGDLLVKGMLGVVSQTPLNL